MIASCGSKSSSNPLNILVTWNQKCTTDDEGESADGTMEFRDNGTVHYVDHLFKSKNCTGSFSIFENEEADKYEVISTSNNVAILKLTLVTISNKTGPLEVMTLVAELKLLNTNTLEWKALSASTKDTNDGHVKILTTEENGQIPTYIYTR